MSDEPKHPGPLFNINQASYDDWKNGEAKPLTYETIKRALGHLNKRFWACGCWLCRSN